MWLILIDTNVEINFDHYFIIEMTAEIFLPSSILSGSSH